ncbi:MAG TPA: hypothetical protein VFQ80_14030, partial [Thermomicrobiales bacterium]|nr:hypothetical protein [Thermomicrobiales bacterium]
MPYARFADTARQWATERAVTLWAFFAGDLTPTDLETIAAVAGDIKADGARFALIAANGQTPNASEEALADLIVAGSAAPSPFGLFAALQEAGGADVRRLGVFGTSEAALEAATRAGAGAIVGIASVGSDRRRALVAAQPDAIVAPGEFASLDAERYASGRAHRQRVLLNPGP